MELWSWGDIQRTTRGPTDSCRTGQTSVWKGLHWVCRCLREGLSEREPMFSFYDGYILLRDYHLFKVPQTDYGSPNQSSTDGYSLDHDLMSSTGISSSASIYLFGSWLHVILHQSGEEAPGYFFFPATWEGNHRQHSFTKYCHFLCAVE